MFNAILQYLRPRKRPTDAKPEPKRTIGGCVIVRRDSDGYEIRENYIDGDRFSTEPPRYFWGPNTRCRKCGCPFFGHPDAPIPDVQYVKSDDHGEALKCTCRRCGYFWFVPAVEKD